MHYFHYNYTMSKQVWFLQKLAKIEPDYVNTEYVYPCKVKKVTYECPLCKKDTHLFSFVKSHLKTIVTPHWHNALSKKTAIEQVDVLQSLYENGRVLESKDTITINGKQYIMTMKGIWSTNYCRTTWSINPFQERAGYQKDTLEHKLLSIFPYVDNSGLLPLKSALIEKDVSLRLESLWVDCEKVLAIHTLSDLMWPNGVYIPVSQLEEDGVIKDKKEPCIISRLQKTNIRLLDLYMMKDYGKKSLIKPAIKEILRVAKMHWWVEDINQYLSTLIQKVIKNRLTLSQYCDKINGSLWEDIARNMTCLAEEVDLVTIEKYDHIPSNPHDFSDNYNNQMIPLMNGIRLFVTVIEHEWWYTVDHQLLADTIRETVKSFVIAHEEQLKKLFIEQKRYERYNFSYWSKKKKSHDDAYISFRALLVRKMFWFVTSYSSGIWYAKILKERLSFLEE